MSGCLVGPNYRAPDVPLPAEFDTGPALLPTALSISPPTTAAATSRPTTPATHTSSAVTRAATRVAPEPVDLAHWWTSLDDPELNRLVARAVEENYDLGMAVARLQQARAALSAAGGNALPLADFTAGAARHRVQRHPRAGRRRSTPARTRRG